MYLRKLGAAACLVLGTTTLCLTSCNIGKVPPKTGREAKIDWKGSGRRVVGYFTNWAQYRKMSCKFKPEDIDARLFTHVIYSFAKIDPGTKSNPRYVLAPFEHNDLGPGGQYSQVNMLKRKHKHLKTLLAVGGWSFNDKPTSWIFTTMVEKPETRAQFVRDAITYLRNNNFDGLDLDWEYPADPERGGRPQDTPNFTALVREFKEAAKAEAAATGRDELILTMAAGASKAKDLELDKLGKLLDWVNLMTYDFNGGWAKTTGMNAPFLGDTNPEGNFYVKKAVSDFVKGGIPREKLVLGIPTYGRSFSDVKDPTPGSSTSGSGPKGRCTGENGFLASYEIKELIDSGAYKAYWDERSGTPYAYNESAKTWITYDNQRSINLKVNWIEEMDLGGAMFWAIDLDDFRNDYPLIRMVAERLRSDRQRLYNVVD